MLIERECDHCNGEGIIHRDECGKCDGLGIFLTDLGDEVMAIIFRAQRRSERKKEDEAWCERMGDDL